MLRIATRLRPEDVNRVSKPTVQPSRRVSATLRQAQHAASPEVRAVREAVHDLESYDNATSDFLAWVQHAAGIRRPSTVPEGVFVSSTHNMETSSFTTSQGSVSQTPTPVVRRDSSYLDAQATRPAQPSGPAMTTAAAAAAAHSRIAGDSGLRVTPRLAGTLAAIPRPKSATTGGPLPASEKPLEGHNIEKGPNQSPSRKEGNEEANGSTYNAALDPRRR